MLAVSNRTSNMVDRVLLVVAGLPLSTVAVHWLAVEFVSPIIRLCKYFISKFLWGRTTAYCPFRTGFHADL